jgi:hypothetical protein
MAYEVLKALQIPEEAHHQPIPVDVLPAFGISKDGPQADLLLAQVALNGIKENGRWYISAFDAVNPPQAGEEEDMYGGISIRGEDTTSDQAFEVSEDWIRESESTLWVPGRTLEISKDNRSMAGVILIRASNVIYEPVPTPQATPQSRGLRRLLARR